MNRPKVRLFLAGMAVMLVSLACGVGPLVAPAATPTLAPTPTTLLPPPPTDTPAPVLAPTDTPALSLFPTDTPIPDMEAILNANGFKRDKTLDEACGSACSAYKNSTLNVIDDYYYTNKSFSLLYYAKDKNGPLEQAEVTAITKLLSELYPGKLSSDAMAVATDFLKNQGASRGVAGNYIWTVSIQVVYNIDNSVNHATIYIGITRG
jgi:hypothetical protein